MLDAFDPTPPDWTSSAVHVLEFRCPVCGSSPKKAERVWINRRSPVFTEENRRKWQEFYQCSCGSCWWAWSSDRPPAATEENEEDTTLPPEA
ncbi:hypothetical protein [Geitlerinema sp. PCC 9228]|jgi:hypothetical protein|uniref:hypothetical protein n=1 Tax=Geitlerinema sp. PCC 9228 TaxID=111611 RepID=UPI0008F9A308|nr:hypothetical protein [Geitlerinema sp. PCC 9228]